MNEIILYKSEDGTVKVDVLFENETVWLTQSQMAELFGCSPDNVSFHLKNIYNDGELDEISTNEDYSVVRLEGNRNVKRKIKHYNLDAIISVGYRVNTMRGTQFRQWATKRLHEYIIKGFALNDERFKSGTSMNYFRELLDRIRDIRISERVFYQQIKDIYTTSIDYDPHNDMTITFFQEVQNKLLWAVSGKTAAELVYYRANAELPQMGLTSTAKPNKVLKSDVSIGKNYLSEEEITSLKFIVDQYLTFAEAQAYAHRPMYMLDWIQHLSMLLTMNQKEILSHKGKIAQALAQKKSEQEYDKYKSQQKELERIGSLKELDADLKRVKQIAKGEK